MEIEGVEIEIINLRVTTDHQYMYFTVEVGRVRQEDRKR